MAFSIVGINYTSNSDTEEEETTYTHTDGTKNASAGIRLNDSYFS